MSDLLRILSDCGAWGAPLSGDLTAEEWAERLDVTPAEVRAACTEIGMPLYGEEVVRPYGRTKQAIIACLLRAKRRGAYSASIANAVERKRSTVQRHLADLAQDGLIEPVGRGVGCRWRATPKARAWGTT